VWVVSSTTGRVNAVVEQGGRRLRAPYGMLREPTDAAPVAVVTTIYNPGELLRIKDGRFQGIWVVIADRGGSTVTLAKLGGDGGRRLRSPRRGLTKVDVAELLS
jgi:hypothetical protein